MTNIDVKQAIGEPSAVRGVYEGKASYCLWLYELERNVVLRIRLDNDDRVVTWKMVAGNAVQ